MGSGAEKGLTERYLAAPLTRYNALCGGERLQDIELRRGDAVFLDGLGTKSLPDPTTAGDFCRRFDEDSILALQEAINRARLRVWAQQDDSFFTTPAIIE